MQSAEQKPEEPIEPQAEEVASDAVPQPDPTTEELAEIASAPEFQAAKYEQQIADLKDQLLRTLAEMENLRKRSQRELEEANKYSISRFARDLVAVYENFFRAAAALPPAEKEGNDVVKNYARGIEMTADEMTRVLERYGIRRVNPNIGEPFDHNQHQAVSQIPSGDHPPGTVMLVMQAGYMLHDRLLNPAMVGVSVALPNQPQAPIVDTQA